MDCKEAGAKGGRTTVTRYSKEELLETRKKGGNAIKEKYGLDYYRELQKKGVEAKLAKKQVKTDILTAE